MSGDVEPVATDPQPPAAMLGDYRRRLVAAMDDMGAALAAMAHSFTMRLDGEPLGFFRVNDECKRHRFHVRPSLEHRADACTAGQPLPGLVAIRVEHEGARDPRPGRFQILALTHQEGGEHPQRQQRVSWADVQGKQRAT